MNRRSGSWFRRPAMPRRAPRRRRVDGCSQPRGSYQQTTAGDRRLSLLTEAASALTYAGEYDRALDVLDEASALVPDDRVPERAELVTKIVFARRMGGRPLESRALIAEMIEVAAARQPRGSLPDAGARARPLLARRVPADVRGGSRRLDAGSRARRAAREKLGRRALQRRQHLSGSTGRRARRAPRGEGGVRRSQRRRARRVHRRRRLCRASRLVARTDRHRPRVCDPRAPARRDDRTGSVHPRSARAADERVCS